MRYIFQLSHENKFTIPQNNIIKNRGNFTDEETWWNIWEDEISCKEIAHSEKFRSDVKDEEEDFVSEKESKFVNGGWDLSILSFFRKVTCLEILIELRMDGKTFRVSCVALT